MGDMQMQKEKRAVATHRKDLHEAIVAHARKNNRRVDSVTDEVLETGLAVRRIEVPETQEKQ